MTAVLVFGGVALSSAVWSLYIRHTANRAAFKAATCDAGLYILSGFNIVLVGRDPWLIVPGALGAWVGSYLTGKLWR